ncbi:MAG: DUF167 domain-containing protein [Candidatus Eisenbacteria bacterium]|nr:DUF167 domain-containing protein [Candidatus Eisenbacteria bacterium]MCC7143719.1 DUF167 domain-containing protein [Candidatus Eisenbacteria bacterium]
MGDRLLLRPHPDGVTLELRVKPKAQTERLVGFHGGALKLSVRAAPERGRATEAVRRLLAGTLSLPLAQVEILSGETSQDKTVLIRGIDAPDLEARIIAALAP